MSTFCNYWNKVSLVKSKIKKSKKIDSIGIGLASPEEIRRWGERQLPNGTLIGKVDKDHTVDYESLKPIEGGLFCERIFGPVEDFYCSCERKGEKNEKFCPTCEVEFTKSRVRRIRMGYIPLAVPVVHVWYLRGRPSYIANLVGKSRNSIDRLAYGETLSESFIGYSSLESIYKKEENVFPKSLHDTVKFNWESNYDGKGLITSNQDSATELRTDQRKLLKNELAVPQRGMRERNFEGISVEGVMLTNSEETSVAELRTEELNSLPLQRANSLQYPPHVDSLWGIGVRSTPLTLSYAFEESPLPSAKQSFAKGTRSSKFISIPRKGKELCKGLSSNAQLEARDLQPVPFVAAEKSVAGGSRAEKYAKDILFGHKQKYLKCHTLPLFSTFVYKEWAHRFSFLEYFIWSARDNDLVLPFYAYQNSKSKKKLANICESIRKSSINLVRNKFSLRFSKKSNCNHSSVGSSATVRQPVNCLQIEDIPPTTRSKRAHYSSVLSSATLLYEAKGRALLCTLKGKQAVSPASTRVIPYLAKGKEFFMLAHPPLVNKSILQEQEVQPHLLQLRNKQGVLRVIKVKKDIGFLFHTKPNFYDISFANNFINNDELRRNQHNVRGIVLTNSVTRLQSDHGTPKELAQLDFVQRNSLSLPRANSLQYPQLRVRRKPSALLRIPLTPTEYAKQRGKQKGTQIENLQGVRSMPITPPYEVQLRLYAKQKGMGLKNCYAFSTIQQDTESTPLTKMDTQQFPRLTELLNFTGGAALRNLLSRFDLIVLSKFLRHELKNLELKVNSLLALKILTYSQGLLLGKLAKRRSKQIRRLKLLELFHSQKSNPEWMILSVIPVLPPDLRPILRVNDDFVVASDLNRLYQTVLRRNNTIHERLDDPLPCPESGLFRQRSLQKAVDGLLENGKGGGTPLCASKRRPLVSLSHVLKGKKGLFRQHLLGKRVDYSGRSVIVVGPRLQVHECGLPKEMAIELFQPFLLHRLKVKGLATSNTTARRMIQQGNPVIWHLLKQLIYEHPVLLNRAPTLHRLGIQAFQPRMVSGRAILLHPLVCNGFNADFDGDQMAVHVPLSFQARAEAWKIMWSKNNFLSPATGQPILVPSQDMVLGCYYLSVSIPRILNANVSIVSHDKAMTDNSVLPNQRSVAELRTQYPLPLTQCSLPLRGIKMNSHAKGYANLRFARGIGSVRVGSEAALLAKMQNKHISKLGISTANQNLHSKAFLNENKGQYFSNLQDSLLAYFQGRLQTHTPFWVRIDHKFARENTASNNSSYSSFVRSPATSDKSSICIPRAIGKPRAITRIDYITQANPQTNPINNKFCGKRGEGVLLTSFEFAPKSYKSKSGRCSTICNSWNSPFFKASKGYRTLLPKVRELLAVNEKIAKEKLNDLAEANSEAELRLPQRGMRSKAFTNIKKMRGVPNVPYASLMNRPNINIDNLKTLKLTFLQPLYGSSRQICKALFQNKSANNFRMRVEANETLESPLELRLSVDGNLANILTMFQNHYNYNATWVKQCKEESIKYMRTTAGRVVINDVVFKDF